MQTEREKEIATGVADGEEKSETRKKRNARKTRKNMFVYAMLLIPVLHFCLFYIYVNFSSFLLAFRRLDADGNYFFTLENFRQVFDSFRDDGGMIRQAITNSLKFFAWNSFVILPLSLFFSFFFYKNIKGKAFFRFMFFVPSIISGVAVATTYKMMLSNDGPAGLFYKVVFHAESSPPFFTTAEYAMKSILFFMFLTGFSTNILLLGGAMSRIPDEAVEAALLDGANMPTELFKITLPMIWPTLSTIIVTTAASILSSSGPILLLTGGAGNTYDISYYIYDKVQIQGQYGVPAALGLVLTAITFPVVMLTRALVNRIYSDVEF